MNKFDESAIRNKAQKDGITHISTGVAVVCDGRLLMVRRAAADFLGGEYELPGGGVDVEETIEAGAKRELYEETGLRVTKVLATFEGFDYSTDKKPRVRQINFLVQAMDAAIRLDPNEHDAFQWVDELTYKDLQMTDNMRRCMQHAFTALIRIST